MVAPIPIITIDETFTNNAPKGGLKTPLVKYDGGTPSNRFTAWVEDTGTAAPHRVHIKMKDAAGGTVWEITPSIPRNAKPDSINSLDFNLRAGQLLADLVASVATHLDDPNTGRRIADIVHFIIPSVAIPRDDIRLFGFEGYTPEVWLEEPVEPGITEDRMRTILREELGTADSPPERNLIARLRPHIKLKMIEVVTEMGIVTIWNIASAIYQPVKDRVYEVFYQNTILDFWPRFKRWIERQ